MFEKFGSFFGASETKGSETKPAKPKVEAPHVEVVNEDPWQKRGEGKYVRREAGEFSDEEQAAAAEMLAQLEQKQPWKPTSQQEDSVRRAITVLAEGRIDLTRDFDLVLNAQERVAQMTGLTPKQAFQTMRGLRGEFVGVKKAA